MKTTNISLLDTEIRELLNYHVEKANHYESCAETQLKIANTDPLYYTTVELKTSEDWIRLAENTKNMAQDHRDRINYIKGLLK